MPRFDVTIAGELNLDLILYGLPAELPPERELLAEEMTLTLGSSSAIVAHNLASLGCRVGFQSLIGEDPLGQIALQRLAESGVETSHVRRSKLTQTGLTVILPRDVWRNILTYPGTISKLTIDDLDFDDLADARHFHLSSYYLQSGLRADVPALLSRLKKAGLTVSLDTNDDPEDRWEGDLDKALAYADIFLPNQREACKIAKTDDVEVAIRKLSDAVPLLIIKRGPDGAVAIRGKERVERPALKVESLDSVGAGDSFDAGFLYAYLRGKSLKECLDAGNAAGALCTTRPGGTEAFRDQAHREKFLWQYGVLS
jgi:sugar/nucleoside kinase (ribokinase family)